MTDLKVVEGGSEKYVYIIGQIGPGGDYEFVKIGISSNPLARMDSLQTGNPVKLHIAGFIDANPWAEKMERTFHLLLDRERVEGEWFRMTERTKAFLEVLGLLDYAPPREDALTASDGQPSWLIAYRKRNGWL